jgi:cytochrome c oxidase subunit 3
MASVATATTLGKNPAQGSLARPSLVSVGTIVWLSSELMFFAALFAIYFTIRSVSTEWPPKETVLNTKFDGFITVILVLSSVTCQAGVFAAEERRIRRSGPLVKFWRWGLREWLVLTFIMGAIFVGGQIFEYTNYVRENFNTGGGMTISSSAYGSIFYLATGFHALHVSGGLVAFIFLLARLQRGRFTPEKLTSTIVVSYYWHFVDVVWIGLFSMIFLIQ